MTRGYVGVALDGPGKKIAVDRKSDGADTVEEQIVRIGGVDPTELAEVTGATPGASAKGMVVRPVGTVTVSGQLVSVAYDYLSLAVGATTETWSYKSGGAGGTLVATVAITYTDASKLVIASVART